MTAIEVKNLKKYFGRVKAVDGVSFTVARGEIFGFLGPNGAGKTTTIRCLMDFLRPTGGEIKILGRDAQVDSVELKKKIGYLSGQIHLYDKWTGQRHLDFVSAFNGGRKKAVELCQRFEFDPLVRTKKLSSGNRQKLGIIMAFMTSPDLLICDEPTNALDPLLQNEVYKLIEEEVKRGATVFMSSHNLREVEKVCNHVGIIKEGKMEALENIDTLKDKKMYTVRVHFLSQIDKRDLTSDNISVTAEYNNSYVLSVKGDVNQVLDKLSHHRIKDLEIERASLEDIFLEYYN